MRNPCLPDFVMYQMRFCLPVFLFTVALTELVASAGSKESAANSAAQVVLTPAQQAQNRAHTLLLEARAHWHQQENAEAVAKMEERITTLKELEGAQSDIVARTLMHQKKFEEAEKLLRENVAQARRSMPGSKELDELEGNYAMAMDLLGREWEPGYTLR
ncbi:MAG: hypothetical protein ACFBZ8_11535 [Opitutales bacterium]